MTSAEVAERDGRPSGAAARPIPRRLRSHLETRPRHLDLLLQLLLDIRDDGRVVKE